MTAPVKLAAFAAVCAALLGSSAISARTPAAVTAPVTVSDATTAKAIRRALAYVYRSASDDANFRDHGDDYVWCFFTIANTARDRDLANAARAMGRERARRWRREHPVVPANASADDISDLVSGAFAAELLGVRDDGFKRQLRRAARRFRAGDYLRFDPAREAPPSDVSDCDPCTKPAGLRSRYDVYTDALIVTYFGDAYGIRLGASYRDVIRWLPRLRPYPTSDREFSDAFFAVSHVVYTLNGYGSKRIAPRLLPDEVAFLERGLAYGIAHGDPEMVGEGLDSLKAFGFGGTDPLIARGIAYLVSSQRPDGSWTDTHDVYTRYHSAWTGIDGLRAYRSGAEIRRLPEVICISVQPLSSPTVTRRLRESRAR